MDQTTDRRVDPYPSRSACGEAPLDQIGVGCSARLQQDLDDYAEMRPRLGVDQCVLEGCPEDLHPPPVPRTAPPPLSSARGTSARSGSSIATPDRLGDHGSQPHQWKTMGWRGRWGTSITSKLRRLDGPIQRLVRPAPQPLRRSQSQLSSRLSAFEHHQRGRV